MTIVIDASTVVALLTEDGRAGPWARESVRSRPMIAPHLLPVEVTHALRRLVVGRRLADRDARGAVDSLARWPVSYVEFPPFAARVWELRDTVSAYDAWYVAVAEAAGAPLVTLDARLARAAGPRCAFEVGPG